MELFFGDRKRFTKPGISPTVREGRVSRLWEPSLTVGLRLELSPLHLPYH
jgi:hypothetical protein